MVKQNIEKKTMELKTAIGSLIVTAFDDREIPALIIDFRPDGCKNKKASNIALVEAKGEANDKEREIVFVRIANGQVIKFVLQKGLNNHE